MSHTSKFPPLKYTTATLPTDLPVGTVAFDTTTNEHKSFNGSSWDVIEGGGIGTPTIVFDSTGPAYDQIQGDIPDSWKEFDTSLKGLVIGTSCTSIGFRSFFLCSGLTGSLVIPDSVTTINIDVFYGCTGFTSLTIPNSVTTIRRQAFANCTGLTGNLVIPDSVTIIESSAFAFCTGFTGSLVIPDSITSINTYTFQNCTGFTSLTIPNSVRVIGGSAFLDCTGFTGELVIPDSVITIGLQVFMDCSGFTGDLVIPNSVTTIGARAFRNCSGLTNVNCYVEKSVLDVSDSLLGTSVTTIHVRSTDSTWTAGAGQTIGGKTGIEVIKDL